MTLYKERQEILARDLQAQETDLLVNRDALPFQILDDLFYLLFVAVMDFIDILHAIHEKQDKITMTVNCATLDMIGIKPGINLFHKVIKTACFHRYLPSVNIKNPHPNRAYLNNSTVSFKNYSYFLFPIQKDAVLFCQSLYSGDQ